MKKKIFYRCLFPCNYYSVVENNFDPYIYGLVAGEYPSTEAGNLSI